MLPVIFLIMMEMGLTYIDRRYILTYIDDLYIKEGNL